MEKIIDALRKVTIFTDLPEEVLGQLASEVNQRTLSANEVLFHEGDRGDSLYFIHSGEVEIYRGGDGKDKVALAKLGQGEYFGEMAILEDKPRNATVRAVFDSELFCLGRDEFVALLDRDARLREMLEDTIAVRRRLSEEAGEPVAEEIDLEDLNTRVFISYSRKDKAFVPKLIKAIGEHNIDTWVDWENIPLTVDWWSEVQRGIENADAFAFIISPDSIASKVCNDEIQVAVESNKRLVPILYRDTDPGPPMHEKISSHNWVMMRTDEELDTNLPEMLRVINTDLEWVRSHTRLLRRALEWHREDRNSSFLLRGDDLANAQAQLVQAAGKQPQPTPLQGEYIQASQEEEAQHKAHEAALERRSRTILRALLVVFAVAAIVAIVLSVFAINQQNIAQNNAATATFALGDAERQKATAEAASTQAIEQAAIASTARADAEIRQAEAVAQRATAQSAREDAIGQRNEAQRQRSIADQLKTEAQAQRLASQAGASLQRGNLLSRGVLLAISSLEKSQNAQADLALRNGLDLLPRLDESVAWESPVLKVAYSPGGEWLATGDQEGNIRVLDAVSLDEVSHMIHTGAVTDLVFNSAGNLLATASADNTARIWDPANGEELARFVHNDRVNAVVFSPVAGWLATASDDLTARTWNIRTGRQIIVTLHTGKVADVAFSPGGSWVASVGADELILWNPTTGVVLMRLYHPDEVLGVAFSPTFLMATAMRGGAVQVWNFTNGAKVTLVSHEQSVLDFTFSPDGSLLATASSDRTAGVWDPETGQAIARLRHDRSVRAVAFSPSGGEIATASADDTARVWNALSGVEIARMEHDQDVSSVAFSQDGSHLATGSADSSLRVWSPFDVGQAFARLDHVSGVVELDLSADNNFLVSATDDDSLWVWDVTTSTALLKIDLGSAINDVAISADGGTIASATQDGLAILWDASTGDRLAVFEHEGAVLDLEFNQGENLLATASADGFARLWDVTTMEEVARFDHPGSVAEVALSDDGLRMATAGSDGVARYWEIETEKLLFFQEHSLEIFLVDIAKLDDGGEALVTVSRDNIIRIWNVSTNALVRIFPFDNDIIDVEVSPDGKKLAISSEDNTVRVVDITTGQEVARIEHADLIPDVIFSREGDLIGTASLDRRALVSDLSPQGLVEEACRRLTRNLTQEEWVQFLGSEDDLYELTCENLKPDPAAIQFLQEEVGRAGAMGDTDRAVLMLQHISQLDPALEFNLVEEVQRLTIETLITQGLELAREGSFEEALNKYMQLQADFTEVVSENYHSFLGSLCRAGANAENAQRALPVCDEAVAEDPENGEQYDNRGRVRTWADDYEGAIEDFQFTIAWIETQETLDSSFVGAYIQDRQSWIASLGAGQNPFDG